ncbi:MAG: molybdenum cofactor guanylyltransferase [Armatimonadota bacterium]
MSDLTGIVLAGGQSRRMGTNKAFVNVDGVPMIERVLRALDAGCAEILIVAKDPAGYAHLGPRVIADESSEQTPLVGVCSGLRVATTPWAFVAACDLPYLSPEAVRLLARLALGYDAAVPRIRALWHPLHAVYARAALPLIDARRAAGERRMTVALDALRVRPITADELAEADPTLRTLRNVNSPAVLKRAP